MPYNPGIQDQRGQFIAQGIGSLGATISDDIHKGLARYQDIQKQKAYGDTVMDHLAQTPGPNGQPYVPIDALNKYHAAGLSAQQGMVTAAQATYATDVQQQTQARQADLEHAQANYYQAHGNYMNARAQAEGSDDGQPFLPVTDSTGKVIPGQIYVKKTGAIHDVSDAGATPVISQDGKFFLDKKTNSFKPLPAATMVLPGMGGGAGAPAGAAGAQPQLPNGPGMTSGAPGLMPQGAAGQRVMTPMDQQALAWAQANPNDPRAAAIVARITGAGQ